MIENENLVSDDAELANYLNNFFSNIVKNLEISKYEVEDDLHLNMKSHRTLNIYEKVMNNQVSTYFEKILSKFQCGLRKGFSNQHCLLLMLEKWKHAVDSKKVLELFSLIYLKHSTVYVMIC